MKKERECEYCDNSKKLIAREFPHVIYGKIAYDNEWQIIRWKEKRKDEYDGNTRQRA